jgi:hypothetical protein
MTGATTGSSPLTGVNYVGTYTFNIGITTITYIVYDETNNTATCSFTVTVNDTQLPAITCPSGSPFNRNTDAGICHYTVQGTEFDPAFSDNCSGTTIINSFNGTATLASAQLPKGSTVITWTATDATGNTANCSITVVVTDNQLPTITCPGNITVSNDLNNCNASVAVSNPVTADNCAVAKLTWTMTGATTANSPATGINYIGTYTFNIGITTITYIVYDEANNTAICSFTVTINDTQLPSLTCPPGSPFNRNTDPGKCYYTVQGAEFDPAFSDNCPGVTITNSYNGTATLANAQLPKGTTTITWTATDVSGNSSNCSITVTVSDNQLPTIICPSNITVSNDPDKCSASVAVSNPVTVDNCAVTKLTWTMTGATTGSSPLTGVNYVGTYTFNIGITTITYIVYDETNNSATCSFTMTVNDTQLPAITCPSGSPFNRNTDAGMCHYTVQGAEFDPSFSDNCPGVTITNSFNSTATLANAQLPKGSTIITWTATDAAGNTANCSITVTVSDNQLPTITCPSNITVSNDLNNCSASVVVPNPVTADNCAVTKLTWTMTGATSGSSPVTGINYVGTHTFNIGITTITYIVYDETNNSATCSFSVTVNDTQLPAITCPSGSPFNRNIDAGMCHYTVQGAEFDPMFSDNCSGPTIINSFNGLATLANAQFPKGTTTIIWTATDAAGNSSNCSITVTVSDNQLPTITCPSNITVSSDLNNCSASVVVPNPVTADNCAVSKLTWTMTGATTGSSPVTGINYVGTHTFSVGTTIVTYHVFDADGNSNSCSFTIKVSDTQLPTISCPAGSPFSRGTVPGGCYYIVQGSEINPATFSDNCPGATIHNSFNNTNTLANEHLPVGVNTITWTVTDAAGLIKTCNITVNVFDDDPPVIVCPPNITVPCPDNIPEPNIELVTATDNCGTVTIVHVSDNYLGLGNKPGFCPTGVERTYRATDAAGNSVTCMQIITVAGECGCVICQSSVPHFYVNMTGSCDSVWTSPSLSRVGKCCSAGGSDRCISFSVKIDPHAIGFYFLIDGATPSGHNVQVDCGPIMPMSSLICAPPDGEYHTVTFCKPGGNENVYTIHSVCGMQFPETIFTRKDCGKTVTISGVIESTVTWTDITGGGIYNRYLSCDHACLNPVITPDSLAPPIIKYLVCGQVSGNPCSPGGIVCDTVIVHVFPDISISISPNPPTFCDYSPGTIYASVYPADMYEIQWWNGPNGTGSIVSTSDAYTPPAPGFYSITVTDTSSTLPCQNDTLNFEVTIDNCVPVCPTQYHCDTSEIVDHSTVSGFIAAGGQINFPCTVPDPNIILMNETSDNNTCPEIITRSYQIWDSCGNVDICQEIIAINDTVPPVINATDTIHRCVQDIVEAVWDGIGDFIPIRPDWYTFHASDTSLDLNPSIFSDNCTAPGNLILHWKITLVGGVEITGIGQISTYPSNIQFPLGENPIIFWLEDQCGNLTPPESRPVVTVRVHARPLILGNF